MNIQQTDSSCKFISWHAIVAGAIVALGLTFLFNMLTLGLGLTMYTHNEEGLMVLAFAGFAWVLIGIYILLFLSGWVTGRLIHRSYSLHSCNGALHGFIMWALYLIFSIVLLSNMTENSISLLQSTFSSLTYQVSNTAATATQSSTEIVNTVRKTGLSTLATFLVFLGGAFGACIGAYYGVGECRKCHAKCGQHDKKNKESQPAL